MQYLKFLKYTLIHKYWVAVGLWKIFKYDPCLKTLPLLLFMITHDISKFHPEEFSAYADFFYKKWDDKKSPKYQLAKCKWEHAWNHHQKSNKHHWQYWKLIDYKGNVSDIGTPSKLYAYEMVADWYGAGKARDKNDVIQWFLDNEDFMNLHTYTQYWVLKAIHNVDWY